jgi:hypothetical protein
MYVFNEISYSINIQIKFCTFQFLIHILYYKLTKLNHFYRIEKNRIPKESPTQQN